MEMKLIYLSPLARAMAEMGKMDFEISQVATGFYIHGRSCENNVLCTSGPFSGPRVSHQYNGLTSCIFPLLCIHDHKLSLHHHPLRVLWSFLSPIQPLAMLYSIKQARARETLLHLTKSSPA